MSVRTPILIYAHHQARLNKYQNTCVFDKKIENLSEIEK